MTRRKRIKKTQKEIDIENQIKILKQQLKIERSKRKSRFKYQNQFQSQNQPIIRNDPRDDISAEIPGIIESGKPIYEEISNTPRNNFHNVILRYKV